MMVGDMVRSTAVAVLACLTLGGCGSGGQAPAGAQVVRVDGSSTVYPVSEAVAEAFQNEQRGRVRVPVGESGTGGGFQKFCRGEVDVVGASRPISTSEMAACVESNIQFVETPVVYDGLTIVVHPSNPINSLTVAQLRRFWEPAAEGTITNWNQVDPSFPDLPLQLYGPGAASGTFDFFTEAVNGERRASRVDYTPTEDDNVTVQGVSSNPGAMGYFGLAFYEANVGRVKALAIDNGAGPVLPSTETVASGVYQPLSRPLFVYFNAESLRRPAVRQFALFYLSHASEEATTVGYVPLPDASYVVYARRISTLTTGTAFAGNTPVGLTIDQLKELPLVNEPPPEETPTP